MKHLGALALISMVALGGCENASRLDRTVKDLAKPDRAEATPIKADHSGSLEDRVARLEETFAKNAEALDFLNKVYAQQREQVQQQERDQPAADAMFAVNIAEAVKAGQVDGPASAPVTIVKAFDFACPYCEHVAGTMAELVKEYNGKVRVVYANMVVHEPARPAHLASCAAAKQGKYKEFKDAFWDQGFRPYASSATHDPAPLGEANILVIAKGLGLDTAKLKVDMGSPECEARIQSDMAEMSKFHVNATPTFFINGKYVAGALSKEGFKQIIDEQLKVAEQSGVAGKDYYDKVVLAKGEKQFRSQVDPKPN